MARRSQGSKPPQPGGSAANAFGATGQAVDSPANRARGAGNSTTRGVRAAQPNTQTEGKAKAPGAVGLQRLSHMHSGQPGGGSHHAQGGNSKQIFPKGPGGPRGQVNTGGRAAGPGVGRIGGKRGR